MSDKADSAPLFIVSAAPSGLAATTKIIHIFIMYAIRMLLTTTPLRNDYCHWSSDYYFVVHMTFQVNHI